MKKIKQNKNELSWEDLLVDPENHAAILEEERKIKCVVEKLYKKKINKLIKRIEILEYKLQ